MGTVMYYQLPDGEPVRSVKSLLPHVINPHNLSDAELVELGIARVVVDYPVLQWWQQRGERVLATGAVPHAMTWEAVDRPLDEVKVLAWERIKDERHARQNGLMPYDYGGDRGILHNEMTEKVRQDLSASTTGAIALQGQYVQLPWTVHENVTVMLSPEEMVAFGIAALQWHGAIHVRSQQIRAAIDAAEDVAGVVAAAEWGEE